jgi:hypothetical protein
MLRLHVLEQASMKKLPLRPRHQFVTRGAHPMVNCLDTIYQAATAAQRDASRTPEYLVQSSTRVSSSRVKAVYGVRDDLLSI